MKILSLEEAIWHLQREKVIAYPTETFYAIGGLALSPAASTAVFSAKQRPGNQPLPVIIGQVEQLPLLAKNISNAEFTLATQFWPAPLSILFKAGPLLPEELLCNSAEVAIRQTPHFVAAEICRLAGPLSGSSANLSGEAPVAGPEQLSHKLLEGIAGVVGPCSQFTTQPSSQTALRPAGDKPSTLVRVVGDGLLELIRPGAVSAEELKKKGWQLAS